jgi:hypothetical protein
MKFKFTMKIKAKDVDSYIANSSREASSKLKEMLKFKVRI